MQPQQVGMQNQSFVYAHIYLLGGRMVIKKVYFGLPLFPHGQGREIVHILFRDWIGGLGPS